MGAMLTSICEGHLGQVVVRSTPLIGILEIDVKRVTEEAFRRIRIDGVPQTHEIGNPLDHRVSKNG
jgi:hypothetical protein